MKIKKHTSLVCIFFIHFICYGQSYIGVTIGREYANITAIENSVYFTISDTGYCAKSILLGLRLEQLISNSFYISLDGIYTAKKVNAYDRGFIPFKELQFNSIKTTLKTNWMPIKSMSIGIGVGYDYISKVSKLRNDNSKEIIFENRKEIGMSYSIGYYYRRFFLNLSFYDGKKIFASSEKTNRFKPINSFSVTLTYLFKVLDRKEGKRVNCPRL